MATEEAAVGDVAGEAAQLHAAKPARFAAMAGLEELALTLKFMGTDRQALLYFLRIPTQRW
jgi:hypothetical protein